MDNIQITGEPSRNGDRCAFIVDRPILPGESAHFSATEGARQSALAADLLAIPGVESVLIADNTVTVAAGHAVDWPALGIGNVIRKLKERGFTVLLVEQNFRFAATVADRHYVMEDGKVVDTFRADEIEANTDKLHSYLGV